MLKMSSFLHPHQGKKRELALLPSQIAYNVAPAQILANALIKPRLLESIEKDKGKHTLEDGDALQDFLDSSGFDLKASEVPASKLGDNYASSPKSNWVSRLIGVNDNIFGRHGNISRHSARGSVESGRGWDIPMTAHEIGHTQAHWGGDPLQEIIARSRPLSVAGMLGGMFEAGSGLLPTNQTLDERKSKLNKGSLISAVSSLPLLANEYHASKNALGIIERAGLKDTPEILQTAGRMLPKAWGTYGLMAAGAALTPQITKLFLPKQQ